MEEGSGMSATRSDFENSGIRLSLITGGLRVPARVARYCRLAQPLNRENRLRQDVRSTVLGLIEGGYCMSPKRIPNRFGPVWYKMAVVGKER